MSAIKVVLALGKGVRYGGKTLSNIARNQALFSTDRTLVLIRTENLFGEALPNWRFIVLSLIWGKNDSHFTIALGDCHNIGCEVALLEEVGRAGANVGIERLVFHYVVERHVSDNIKDAYLAHCAFPSLDVLVIMLPHSFQNSCLVWTRTLGCLEW